MTAPDAADQPADTLRFLAEGVSARLYHRGEGQVVKLFRTSVSEEMIAREMAASRHARSAGLPAVAALERCVQDGQRGLLYPLVPGETLMRWVRRHPGRAGVALDRMAQVQVAMHACPGGALRPVKTVLETDIAYGPAPDAIKRQAIDYLRALPDGGQLLHGDFHLDNILIDPAEGLHIIDWSKAASGHRAADIVRSEMLMRFGAGPSDWITRLWRDWAAGRLVRRHLAAGSVSKAELAQWRPVVALAWLRARDAGREQGFRRYLDRAMTGMGLPPVPAAS